MGNNTFRGGLYALVAVVCAWASSASAAIVAVTLDAAVSDTIVLGQVDTAVPGVVTFTGSSVLESGSLVWTVNADPDPFIQANFSITNTTAVTQIFDFTFGLPIMALPNPILKSGSLAAGFSDAGGSGGATLDVLNWDGLIDGAAGLELFSGSFSCGGGPGCNGSIAPVSAGPVNHPGGVNTDIGINVVFSLTAGDSATFDTRFEVLPVPVPVPAAVWLFGSGLIGLAGVARRRKQIQ